MRSSLFVISETIVDIFAYVALFRASDLTMRPMVAELHVFPYALFVSELDIMEI